MFFLGNADVNGVFSVLKVFEGENVTAAAEGFAIFIPSKKRFRFFSVQSDRNGAAVVVHDPIKTEIFSFKGVTDGTQPFYQDLADIRPAPSDMQTITIDPYPVLDKSHRTVYTDGVRYYNKLETTSEKVLSSSDAESKIYSDGNTLYVKNAIGRVVLYEVNGRVVYSKKAEENAVIEISNLKTGVYLLVVDGSPSKVLVR